MTQIRSDATRIETLTSRSRGQLPGWIIAVVVVIVAVAVGGGYLLRAATSSSSGVADDSVVQLIDENIRALNEGDKQALAATYTDEAIMTDMISGSTWRGADTIAKVYTSPPPSWNLERVSEVVQTGQFASTALTYYNGRGIAVWRIVDGKIAHQWAIGR